MVLQQRSSKSFAGAVMWPEAGDESDRFTMKGRGKVLLACAQWWGRCQLCVSPHPWVAFLVPANWDPSSDASEEKQRMFITLREDVPNGKTNTVFLQRSRHCQHLKVLPSQSVSFNEHPDLKQWKLITLSLHNFQRAFICEGKEMEASCSLLTINQLSKTLLQSFSASLIWSLEHRPSVDENLSNMTSPCSFAGIQTWVN